MVFNEWLFLSSGVSHGSLTRGFLFVFFCVFVVFTCMLVETSKSKRRSRSGWDPVFARIEWLQGSLLYSSREESLGNHFFEGIPEINRKTMNIIIKLTGFCMNAV